MTQPPPKKSDLAVRTLSAVVMLAVAGTALWLGGWWWTVFVLLLGFGVVREWVALATGFTAPGLSRFGWVVAGAIYCGLTVTMLITLRGKFEGAGGLLSIVGAVIGTDIGAYFVGRTIGGPKIAPSLSPSKTWSGLLGGMIGAACSLVAVSSAWSAGLCRIFYPSAGGFGFDGLCSGYIVAPPVLYLLLLGAIVAIIAQAGDFFESWMKRRAGVKDSGRLIPGHGGLFDRVDGLLAVLFVIGVLYIIGAMTSL
ncbi:MAG: phosphatidate cytidylyltransferase [Novosphingobium sp.]